MNDSLLELVYDDPLNAWEDIPVLELSGPLDGRWTRSSPRWTRSAPTARRSRITRQPL